MTYMQRQAARRIEPEKIVTGATRAVLVTKDYYSEDPPTQPAHGRVARYARGRDYHTALARPLAELADFIRDLGPSDTLTRWFVDAGPVPERELAQRAGIGWIGKNTMLISPDRGSFFFLAAVLTNLDLPLDNPFEEDRCGTCRRCIDACPTHAFPEQRVLDASRCISYLTIEHRGSIAPNLAKQVDDWMFGCDVCQEVCPWNVRFASPVTGALLEQSSDLAWLNVDEFATLTDEEFDARYGWTPLERPGLHRMRRNADLVRANLATQSASNA